MFLDAVQRALKNSNLARQAEHQLPLPGSRKIKSFITSKLSNAKKNLIFCRSGKKCNVNYLVYGVFFSHWATLRWCRIWFPGVFLFVHAFNFLTCFCFKLFCNLQLTLKLKKLTELNLFIFIQSDEHGGIMVATKRGLLF